VGLSGGPLGMQSVVVVLPWTGAIGVSLTCSDIDVEKNVR